jgi:hypothetical protein
MTEAHVQGDFAVWTLQEAIGTLISGQVEAGTGPQVYEVDGRPIGVEEGQEPAETTPGFVGLDSGSPDEVGQSHAAADDCLAQADREIRVTT